MKCKRHACRTENRSILFNGYCSGYCESMDSSSNNNQFSGDLTSNFYNSSICNDLSSNDNSSSSFDNSSSNDFSGGGGSFDGGGSSSDW